MVINSFYDILNILTAFLSLFFGLYLLSLKSKNRLPNVLIGLYLLITAVDSGTLFISQFISPSYPGISLLISTTFFISPPLLYFYIYSVTYQDFKLKPKHLLHVIPFMLAILILIPRYYLADFDQKIEILSSRDGLIVEMKLVYLMLHIQLLTYIIASYFLIIKSKKLLLENYSNVNINYFAWFNTLLALIALELIVSTFKNVFMIYEVEAEYHLATTITGLVALIFICWLVIKALQSPELYGRLDSKQISVKHLIARTNLKNSEEDNNNEYIEKIKIFMKQKEPYLDPSLSVYNLSKQLDIPAKELSVLINHNLNQHFFDFVNKYRIKKAMELLSDSNKSDLTVLEILYEVGFNSKSSFNTAFKKYTKLTPTQYRSQHMV